MTFPIYFFISLVVLSPWPIVFSIIFYFVYIFDTTFEYYITKTSQLRRFWSVVVILPVFCTYIFWLRYKRIGISIDFYNLKKTFIALVEPLGWFDIVFLGIFIVLIISCVMLGIRCIYQYYRKCILALYLYYYQYEKISDYYMDLFYFFAIYYDNYLWSRVKIFTKNPLAFIITDFIWPTCTTLLERNLYQFIIPYLIIFDIIVEDGIISKVFIILPWYYIYSLIRFGIKYFFTIHKSENWRSSISMYGWPR